MYKQQTSVNKKKKEPGEVRAVKSKCKFKSKRMPSEFRYEIKISFTQTPFKRLPRITT